MASENHYYNIYFKVLNLSVTPYPWGLQIKKNVVSTVCRGYYKEGNVELPYYYPYHQKTRQVIAWAPECLSVSTGLLQP